MIDFVDLGFKITYAEHKNGAKRPDTEIEGTMSDINLRLTQYQLKFLMAISKSVPASFAEECGDGDAEAAKAVDEGTLQRARTISQDTPGNDQTIVNLGPELETHGQTWTKLDLVFRVNTIGLELVMAEEDKPVIDLAK